MLLLVLALASEPCSQAKSGMDQRICYGQLAVRTDREMAAQWRSTLAIVRSEDAQNRRDKANRPNLAEGLLASQRAWLRFRDAQCNMVSDQAAGGTAAGEFDSRCRIALNLQRTIHLKQRADALIEPGYP